MASKVYEHKTVFFEIATNADIALESVGGVDLESVLDRLSRDEGWEVIGMAGGLGGTVSAQRKGMVLLRREV